MAQTQKRKPRQTGLRKLKSNVEDFKDIKWDVKTGNPIIDSSVINDDFSLTINFHNKDYQVRSPDRRIIKKVRNYTMLINQRDLTDDENCDMDDAQDILVEDMVVELKVLGKDRVSEQEFDNLLDLCLKYWTFGKKKSVGQLTDST